MTIRLKTFAQTSAAFDNDGNRDPERDDWEIIDEGVFPDDDVLIKSHLAARWPNAIDLKYIKEPA